MINTYNQQTLDSFTRNLRSSGKSQHTVRAYANGISQFLDGIADLNIKDIEYANAEDWMHSMSEAGKSSATISLYRAALTMFIKYIKKREGRNAQNLDNVFTFLDSMPKKPVRKKVIWPVEKALSLIEKTKNTDPELSTLLALGIFSGRRKMELTRFRVDDFKEENLCCDKMFYESSEIQTKGQGGKPLNCYILTNFKPYLDYWLEKRPVDSEWLFPDHKDPTKHIDDTRMGSASKQIKRMSGYEDFHWHLLRHTFVTKLGEIGLPIEIITSIIGWESVEMFKTYNDVTKKQTLERFFNGFKYKDILISKGYKGATVNTMLHGLNAYAKYLGESERVKEVKVVIEPFLTDEMTYRDYRLLVEGLLRDKNYKWYIIVKLLATTGLRIGEATGVTFGDIRKGKCIVYGKGQKPRTVYFSDPFRETIMIYMMDKSDSEKVIPHSDAVCRIELTRFKERYRLPCRCSPHEFQRFFAREVYERTKDIELVRGLLGHQSIKVTARYIRKGQDKARELMSLTVTW